MYLCFSLLLYLFLVLSKFILFICSYVSLLLIWNHYKFLFLFLFRDFLTLFICIFQILLLLDFL